MKKLPSTSDAEARTTPTDVGCVKRETAGSQGRPPAVSSKTPVYNATIESTVTIEGRLEGRHTRMLVDTGSAVTIVSEDVWREVAGHYPLQASRPVIAANGEPLHVLGRVEAKMQVGTLQTTCPALMARVITHECLLGADFLLQHQCVVDLQRQELWVDGRAVTLEAVASPKPSVFHVRFHSNVTVPAWHQMQVQVDLAEAKNSWESNVGFLEPAQTFMEKHNLLVAISLCCVQDGQIQARVLNPSPLPVVIHQYERIGLLQHLDQACAIDSLPENSASKESPQAHKEVA